MKLSVLVATMPTRKEKLDRLLDHLRPQVVAAAHPTEVVVDDAPYGNVSIGMKRQRMLTNARGEYVTFVDDDDWVPDDYLRRIFAALDSDPGVDCLSLVGTIVIDGARQRKFYHSIANGPSWYEDARGYIRPPSHLNTVRRDLAIKAGFTDVRWAEDFEYSQRLFPLLVREVSTGDEPLYTYLYDSKKGKGT